MLTIHKATQFLRPRYSHLLLMAMLGRIELLFDDLLDTNNWMLRERAREPLGLIVLGTSGQYNTSDQSEMEAAMQNARYESGQDNSPMCEAHAR